MNENRYVCQPDMTGLFDRMGERTNDILMSEIELPVLVDPAIKVLAERKTGDGDVAAIYEIVLHQEMQDFWLMGSEVGVVREIERKRYWGYRRVCKCLP